MLLTTDMVFWCLVQEVLRDVGKPESLQLTITTDNGANIRAACERYLVYDWLPCICHVLHLAVTHALEYCEDKPILSKCSNLASYFRKS
jgi:hypothetical protein